MNRSPMDSATVSQTTTAEGTGPLRRFLTASELESWVPWTLNTIRCKTSRREIPHSKCGHTVLYDWERISAWIEDRAVEPEEASR